MLTKAKERRKVESNHQCQDAIHRGREVTTDHEVADGFPSESLKVACMPLLTPVAMEREGDRETRREGEGKFGQSGQKSRENRK